MTDRHETCRVYRATIPLSLLQISDLYMVPTRFSESLNEKYSRGPTLPKILYEIQKSIDFSDFIEITTDLIDFKYL